MPDETPKTTVANPQKLKLLHVYRMLMEETDEEHGLTLADILARLQDAGISAERKSIYRDIEALRQFGVPVVTYRRSPVEYAVTAGKPTLPELSLLLDAVQGSRFLSESKSRQLSATLKGMASTNQRASLDKFVHVEGRVKSQNDSVFHNVDTIHEAIRSKRKITFMYFKYGTDLERHPTRDRMYEQTPVRLVFADGMYYLITWSDNRENFVTFRVDRMNLLQVSDKPATRNKRISEFAYEGFEHKAFGMYAGETRKVTLRVKAPAMDVMMDRFGREALTVTGATPEACDIHVSVAVSPQFFGWLAGLHGVVELTAPSAVVAEYREWARSLV